MKRLFAAIKIHPSDKYRQLFNGLNSALRQEKIKWVEPENMHLTLKFFGETDEKQIPGIRKALVGVTADNQPFIMKIADVGVFGSHYDPRVIWFGIEKNPALLQLAENTLSRLETIGWERDRQNFVPHLTVGRIKELRDKPLFQQVMEKFRKVEIQEEQVREIILFESILRREGPLYLKVASFSLAVL
jgi:2'-5' RNA ligase